MPEWTRSCKLASSAAGPRARGGRGPPAPEEPRQELKGLSRARLRNSPRYRGGPARGEGPLPPAAVRRPRRPAGGRTAAPQASGPAAGSAEPGWDSAGRGAGEASPRPRRGRALRGVHGNVGPRVPPAGAGTAAGGAAMAVGAGRVSSQPVAEGREAARAAGCGPCPGQGLPRGPGAGEVGRRRSAGLRAWARQGEGPSAAPPSAARVRSSRGPRWAAGRVAVRCGAPGWRPPSGCGRGGGCCGGTAGTASPGRAERCPSACLSLLSLYGCPTHFSLFLRKASAFLASVECQRAHSPGELALMALPNFSVTLCTGW